MNACSNAVLTASQEDYLETIFWLVQEQKVARSKDISDRLGVSKSSVTGALRQLTAGGLINYDPYSYVTLTAAGEALAEGIVHRHRVLADFLARILGMGNVEADANACRIEHAIDDEVLQRLESFVAYLDKERPDLCSWTHTFEDSKR